MGGGGRIHLVTEHELKVKPALIQKRNGSLSQQNCWGLTWGGQKHIKAGESSCNNQKRGGKLKQSALQGVGQGKTGGAVCV